MDEPSALSVDRRTASQLARLVLVAFLFTFLAARTVVFLIMSRRVPDLYAHVGGTHVHHLNYGIFLLVAAGAWLIFTRPAGRALSVAAVIYGIGLALTSDEFGMWLHLGGSYWQRASFDAVVVIAALLGLIAFAPQIRRFRPRHWTTAALLALALAIFALALADSIRHAQHRLDPVIKHIEQTNPN